MFRRRPPRDVDTAGHAQNLQALGWSLFGGVIGGCVGFLFWRVPGFIVGWVVGTAGIYLVAVGLASRVADVGAKIIISSGASTPAKRQYSQGEALAVQGKLEAAIAEYERCAQQYPDDPEPRIRLARLQRDRRSDYEAAVRWFKDVLSLPALDAGTEMMVSRELVELFANKLSAPERALPVLARLAEKHAASRSGAWARDQIREIKDNARDSS